jgi:glycosyltransferase involved in cell wall biosynthesis
LSFCKQGVCRTVSFVVNTQPLRVAVLNRIFKPTGGGAERYSIALVEQLAKRHEMHIFAQDIDHHWPGVVYHRIPTPFVKPRWINQLWFATATWWLTRKGFDVVHSHENTWHGQVQTVHVVPVKYGLLHGRSGWRMFLRYLKIVTSPRLLAYWWLEHARYRVRSDRRIVLASQRLQPIMESAYPRSSPLCTVLTPGVAHVHEQASSEEKLAARAKLALPCAGRCVLFVGNDYRKKGLPALLGALKHLPADYYLAVVGNSSQIAGFQHEVQTRGLGERVFFLGALNPVDVAYRAADCLAHPTLEDTFAMVVLEALAFSLPVVVSGADYCGISELLVHEQDALLVEDPTDSVALGSALNRVLSDSVLRAHLQTHGKHFARQYLWSEIAVQQEQIYESVSH